MLQILQHQLDLVLQLRAQSQKTFTGLSHQQMDQDYEKSGFTPNMLLASYDVKIQELHACKEWVESIIE